VVSYINSEMLFWACNTQSEEGNRVGQTLRASSFPFLALIVLREARMTIVGR
jgi:FAS-associated factor 2